MAAKEGRQSELRPNWTGLHDYLVVDEGPKDKPYLRPFWHGSRNAEQEWLNPNLAGSFAASSLRMAPSAPFSKVVEVSEDGRFSFRANHAGLALSSLLYGQYLDALHLALFLYRNRGVWSSSAPTGETLVNCFRSDFGYQIPEDDDEFVTLYTVDPSASGDLFEIDESSSWAELDESPSLGHLTAGPIRFLTATELGRTVIGSPEKPDDSQEDLVGSALEELTPLPKSNSHYIRVISLMRDYGGVIFVGPSGTGKSYYARRIALTLTDGETARCRFVQFHPSYQYEDFMEGFRPKAEGDGFELRESHFLELCRLAQQNLDQRFVLVIDELSRGDPGRVFGEALTYLELSKRGISFHLASGKEFEIPKNVFILATMNPLDYGAEQVDAAFDRRFAKIRMDPDRSKAKEFLQSAGMEDGLTSRVLRFFDRVNQLAHRSPYASIGHTYFSGISNVSALKRLWEHQLRFNLEKAFPFDRDQFDTINTWWTEVVHLSTEADSGPGQDDTPDNSGV